MSNDSKSGGQPLANPKPMRNFSDRLDSAMGWEGKYKEDSKVRGFIHGTWHQGAGLITGNEREFDRAREQFDKVKRPSPPPPGK